MSVAPDRAAYTAGLRQLADVLDANPDVPLPYHGSGTPMGLNFLAGADPKSALAAAVRAFPCDFAKNSPDGSFGSQYYQLTGTLHGLKVALTAYRDAVCERVVTGTRGVTETVPDPDVADTRPMVERTRTVEDVEWRCTPLLAEAVAS